MSPKSVVVLGGGSVQNALCNRLLHQAGLADSRVRGSPVMDSLDGLIDVCRGADIVYLLSALDLPAMPDEANLRIFRAGVDRVLESCQECGIGNLVFMSSSRVVSRRIRGAQAVQENSPFVTVEEDEIGHAIAIAEAEVLKVSGTLNYGGSCLYTCALRPAALFGTGEDRSIHRALSWVGWGLNRVAVCPRNVQRDMLFEENLIEAQLLVGKKLAEGTAGARAAGSGWSAPPICSGQAYFVTDGHPYNPQGMMDDILERLDFPTAKLIYVPRIIALAIAGGAELIWKMRSSQAPVLTQQEVEMLTKSRRFSITRLQKDVGYTPSVDPSTALNITVETLKGEGWGRHIFASPGLVWWVASILGMWLMTISAFENACPKFLLPFQRYVFYLHISVFRTMWILRLGCVLAYAVHLWEGWYAFGLALKAGHRDTAPLWLIQTTVLGYPSLRLLLRLLS
ncbi:unnamed protein product [Ascophyllum nodosum]